MTDPLTSWRLGPLEVPNRVLMGSMHTGFERDGERLAAFYTERVRGGAGLIVTGGYAVEGRGRSVPDDIVLGDPALDPPLRRSVEAVHAAGGLIAVQLFHAGRYSAGLPDADGVPVPPVAPSPVAWRAARGVVPVQMSEADIAETLRSYARAGAHAEELGYDAIEISASEGYLINAFCSPLTNLRQDAWGGDAHRRRRFAREVVSAVRAATGLPLIARISGDDLMTGSSTRQEVLDLAEEVVAAGADAVSVGVGWHESPVPTVQFSVPHGAWLSVDERVAAHLPGTPVIGSNRICSLAEARRALENTRLAAVALARPFLADPDVVTGAVAGRTVIPCIGCNEECIDHSMRGRPISCLVNPRAGREGRMTLATAPQPRRLAVVGAGPAGLVGALDAVRRGHRVTLFEADPEVGGQLRLAGLVSGKSDYLAAARALARRFVELGGELVLGRRIALEELAGFDAALLATGVRPRRVEIDTDGSCTVLGYREALEIFADSGGSGSQPAGSGPGVRTELGDLLVIGGGGVAVDVAATLAPRAGRVTLIRRGSRRFAAGTSPSTRWIGLGELRTAGAQMWNNARLVRVRRAVATVEVRVPATPSGPAGAGQARPSRVDEVIEQRDVPVDTLVVAVGSEPRVLTGSLSIPHRSVGGARDAGGLNAARSTREALEAVRDLVG